MAKTLLAWALLLPVLALTFGAATHVHVHLDGDHGPAAECRWCVVAAGLFLVVIVAAALPLCRPRRLETASTIALVVTRPWPTSRGRAPPVS